MNKNTQILSLAIALAFAGAASADPSVAPVTPPETTEAADPLNEADVRDLMTTAGYTEINDVKFKEGTWTADGKSADGNHVEVRIDSETGNIIPDTGVASINRDQIIIIMQKAGYTNVHDVDMEGGVWKAEGNDSSGADVEVKLDPTDGHILGSEKDKVDSKK